MSDRRKEVINGIGELASHVERGTEPVRQIADTAQRATVKVAVVLSS